MTPFTDPSPAGTPPSATLHVGALALQASACEASGVAIDAAADGLVRVRIDRLAVRDVTSVRGAVALQAASAVLHRVDAHVAIAADARSWQVRDLTIGAAELTGVEASAAWAGTMGDAIDDLRLDALADLDGVLRAFVTDALWFVDAELTVPIVDGRVRIAAIDVEHIGPNSRLGVDPRGLFVQAPHGGRAYLASFGAGATPSVAPPVTPAGELDLAALIAAVLGRRAGAPTLARADLLPALLRTSLVGELQLGNGALGGAGRYILLAGREEQRNGIELSSPALGERLVVHMPRLLATSTEIMLAAHVLRTATLAGAIDLVIQPRAADRVPRVQLAVTTATIDDVRITPAPSLAAG